MLKRYLLLLVLVFLVACGGEEEPTPAPPTDPPPTDTPVPPTDTPVPPTDTPEPTDTPVPTDTPIPPTDTPEPSNAVGSLEDVRNAVVRIEYQGTFVDPGVGTIANAGGGGSGFIISEDGIAVTNNHVVTGAALLRVYVEGEDEPRNARVLGVSECSDLAVIDIDGDDFPYLEWYEDDINVGLEVYTAGFPFGDPEFTLTRGIVSKADADGESNWASVDRVLEHDATINPGNSGGPLVTADGLVVGVNYAGIAEVDQYFAIRRGEALSVIETLQGGQDVTSIGVNGTAVYDGESGLSGIWVSSVESGTPADNAGVRPGDIITSLEGLFLATDGTMADYCDILRSRSAEDVMRIQVLRYDTSEVLEGQLNGDEMVVVTSFEEELEDEIANDGSFYTEYVFITDNSGTLEVEVPVEWNDVDGAEWVVDGDVFGPSIAASSDLDGFFGSWGTPGIFFASIDQFDTSITDVLDTIDFSDQCIFDSRNDYEDSLYTGQYDLYTDCGEEGSLFIQLAVVPEDQSFVILVWVTAITDADLDALDRILDSFIVYTE